MPVDKCGRTLHPGQLVDLCIVGMYPAYVMEVRENKVVVPGMKTPPPTVVVQLVLQLPINPANGVCDLVYVVAEPQGGNHKSERVSRATGPRLFGGVRDVEPEGE